MLKANVTDLKVKKYKKIYIKECLCYYYVGEKNETRKDNEVNKIFPWYAWSIR